MEKMLYAETERMIKAYGNHPSFRMLSASNEPKGRWKQSLPRWAEHFRREDPRILYTTGTGHTDREIPDPEEGADFLVVQRLGEKMLRGQSAWFGRDYRASLAGVKIPVLSHELGQWVAYPDYSVIDKFKGYARPGNYEIFRDSMRAHGLLSKNKQFARASGRYQLACYKEEIEANLRTPGLAGFQLLDLHDYTGQGTALVGLLDPFWESKGYATPNEFRRFNSETVPLARLNRRVFTSDETLEAEVEVAHYGAAAITNAAPSWKVIDARGRVLTVGRWPARTIPVGKNTPLGRVSIDLSKLAAPRQYKLSVGFGGTAFENDWDFWLYPPDAGLDAPPGVFITRSWDEAELRLKEGGRVLYVPRRADLDWTSPPLDDVPVFWNRLMGPAWGRMLGLLSETRHPALAAFPGEANFDWQWSEVVRGARAVNLDRLPRALAPIVWAIDDWNRNYKLGLLFECRVGRGRLLVSGADLSTGLDARPAARQLRSSLLAYMASPRFRPNVAVRPEELRGLLFDTRVMKKLGTEAKGESLPANPASNAIDGDPNTFWLAGDARKNVRHPHQALGQLRPGRARQRPRAHAAPEPPRARGRHPRLRRRGERRRRALARGRARRTGLDLRAAARDLPADGRRATPEAHGAQRLRHGRDGRARGAGRRLRRPEAPRRARRRARVQAQPHRQPRHRRRHARRAPDPDTQTEAATSEAALRAYEERCRIHPRVTVRASVRARLRADGRGAGVRLGERGRGARATSSWCAGDARPTCTSRTEDFKVVRIAAGRPGGGCRAPDGRAAAGARRSLRALKLRRARRDARQESLHRPARAAKGSSTRRALRGKWESFLIATVEESSARRA